MNCRRLFLFLCAFALSGCFYAAFAQGGASENGRSFRRCAWSDAKNTCVIKIKMQEGDSGIKVFRLEGDGEMRMSVDSIRSIILQKGVDSPEFQLMVQKLAQELGANPRAYTLSCSPLPCGKAPCPGKRTQNCPEDKVCDDDYCPGRNPMHKRNKKTKFKAGGGEGCCEAMKTSKNQVVIKKISVNKDESGRAFIEVEKNIDGKVFRLERNVSEFCRRGGLSEAEFQNLISLFETPCVQELIKTNPEYAQLREKLLSRGAPKTAVSVFQQLEKTPEKNEEAEINLAPAAFLDFRCYPNPNEGTFTIEFTAPEKNGPTMLQVFDPSGKKIYEETVEAGAGKYSKVLNFPQAAKGAYTVTLENNYLKRTQKIIIR